MKFPRRKLLVAATAATALAAWAYNITGTVTDQYGEPLMDATVRILNAGVSAFVKGTIADLNGGFKVSGLKNGNYLAEVTYIGYETTSRPLRIADASLKLDTIKVNESSYMLKETTVIGVKTPIKVMQDTVEFNADTYKTPPNSVVEDLLKRLPGVEVDSDGKITANGKEVTKILVDGKEFFADDPKVASKNLPVNMVDKLQVVDRKSDLARLTGVDDGEDETVINLTVKKGMKNGWFGTVEAGYGTDDRYQATFNVNRFWNDNQITFIGSANNTNELGFTDGNGNRFRRFGGDQGINNSQSVGVNFNVGNQEILRVGGDVMYSHTNRTTLKRQMRDYLLSDSYSREGSTSDALDRGHNVRADFRIEWKPDSFNTVDFRPTFSYNTNRSDIFETDTLYSNNPAIPMVNRSFNQSNSHGDSYEATGRLIYNHNFRSRRGRSISLMANYRFSDVREYENAFSYNHFYMLKSLLDASADSIDSYEQYTDSHTWANTVSARLSWTEPLGDVSKGRFLTFSYRLQYRWNNADKSVERRYPDFANGSDDPMNLTFLPWQYMDQLSNSFRNDFLTQDIRLGFKLVKPKYNLDLGVSAVPSMSKSKYLSGNKQDIPERWVWNFAPFMRLRYKFDKQSSMNLMYMGRSTHYENVGGVWNIRAMNMFSQPFGRNKTWSFNNNAFVFYNHQAGYNNGLLNRSGTLMFAESPSIAFRPQSLELELRPHYRVQWTHNSIENINTPTVHSYGGSFNGSWYAPFGLVLASDVTYSANKGYSEGFNTNTWLWNASISYQFMAGRAATVMLKVYDLLQQKNSIQRQVTANYIDDIEYNSLTRYFMLTFTYKFNTFGKGNEPTDRNNHRWGPGGPGGPPPGGGRGPR